MEYVSKEQFTEYGNTVEAKLAEIRAEDKRQNHRLDNAEEWQNKFTEMQMTLKAQGDSIKEMGEKLNKLVEKPAKRWESFMGYLGTAVAAALVGYFFNLLIG